MRDDPPNLVRLDTTSAGLTRATFYSIRQTGATVWPDGTDSAQAIAVFKRRGLKVEDQRGVEVGLGRRDVKPNRSESAQSHSSEFRA